MNIETTRFGRIEVATEMLIDFPRGLHGFQHLRRWIVWEHRPGNPFQWLQSADEPKTALMVTQPELFLPGCAKKISDALGLDESATTVLCSVALDRETRQVRANLCGPIVIDRSLRRGGQHIVDIDGLDYDADLLALCRKGQAAAPESAAVAIR
jgi:flagellar assembly factor FliW